jgi:amino acid permease
MSQLTFFEFDRDRRQTNRLRSQSVFRRVRRFRGMIAVVTIVTLISLGLVLNLTEMILRIASSLQWPAVTSLVICLLLTTPYWRICRCPR